MNKVGGFHKRLRKQVLVLVAFFACLQCYAQQSARFFYRMLTDSILQIQWTHDSLDQQEYIGDALENKNQEAFKPLGTTSVPFIKINGTNNIHFQSGDADLKNITGFDNGDARGFRITMPDDAAWFGGGERTVPLDRRGQRIPLYNAPQYGYELDALQLNYSVPFVMCSNGVGLLFDNPATGYIDFGKSSPNVMEIGFVSGNVNMIVIPGKTPKEILERYAAITGHQPLPPRWALGNFVSRFGYRSQQQVLQTAADMQANGFPMDAIVIDVFWFGNTIQHTLGNLDFVDKSKWPDPEKMITTLGNQQVKTILVTEPFILQNTKNFEAAQPYLAKGADGKPFMLTDFYFGYGGLLDLFRPDVRQWFFSFYKKYTDWGVAGWWGDLGEPEKHPAGMMHNLSSFGVSRRMPADHVHNMYGHMWSKMMHDGWRKSYKNKRLFYLNRAGFAGSQRYSIFPWTGDVSRSWNGFKAQLYNLQSMSLSGVPYIHSDAGGFSMVDKDDPELYTRWLQMAVFSPILRPHGTDLGADLQAEGTVGVSSEPVYKPEPFKTIARNLIEERYRLLPYNYSLAYQATSKGQPLIRPMFYSSFSDKRLWQKNDQYMYGDAFLVKPVTGAGTTEYAVFFPEGIWYNYNNPSATIQGKGNDETVSTSLSELPVWVKEGSFVPNWRKPPAVNTEAYNESSEVVMRFYPGNSTAIYTLFDDDGKSTGTLDNAKLHTMNYWRADKSINEIELNVTCSDRMIAKFLALPVLEDGRTLPSNFGSIKSITLNGRNITNDVKIIEESGGKWMQISLPVQIGNHQIVFAL